jgi:hypothetical protein
MQFSFETLLKTKTETEQGRSSISGSCTSAARGLQEQTHHREKKVRQKSGTWKNKLGDMSNFGLKNHVRF